MQQGAGRMADAATGRGGDWAGWLAHRVLPFYRAYPYDGPLGWSKVDPRGAYSPVDGFFFNRVPKSANSTVTAALARHSSYRQPLARKAQPKEAFLRPAFMSARAVARLERDVFTFTFVRNPYRRTLSAFSEKVLRRKPQSRPFYAWFGADREPGFLDFCRYLEAGGLYDDIHWAPQADILLLPVEMFDFIGRVERIGEDLPFVLRRIFGDGVEVEMKQAGPRSGAGDRAAEHYCDAAQQIVQRLYRADFNAFGYSDGL